jgi:hypothetical protein
MYGAGECLLENGSRWTIERNWFGYLIWILREPLDRSHRPNSNEIILDKSTASVLRQLASGLDRLLVALPEFLGFRNPESRTFGLDAL